MYDNINDQDEDLVENADDIPFKNKKFLSKWYPPRIKKELYFYLRKLKSLKNEKHAQVAMIILSRTARSVRATTHFDLATLKKPIFEPYYCYKHKKICMPVQSIKKHLKEYTRDILKRIEVFSKIRTSAYYQVINADSRLVNIEEELKKNTNLLKIYDKEKINGIFTSPPYIGQIDYHEQHAYAYELFDLKRLDELEIGPKFLGTSKKAIEKYVKDMVDVFTNVSQYLSRDALIFVVVNDKRNLYPRIFEKSNMKIVKTFHRPVLNRTERDRSPYFESIFEVRQED